MTFPYIATTEELDEALTNGPLDVLWFQCFAESKPWTCFCGVDGEWWAQRPLTEDDRADGETSRCVTVPIDQVPLPLVVVSTSACPFLGTIAFAPPTLTLTDKTMDPTLPLPKSDRWQVLTCARCGFTGPCTPWSDYYETHLWEGEGRVCEACMNSLASQELRKQRQASEGATE